MYYKELTDKVCYFKEELGIIFCPLLDRFRL